MTVFAEFGFRQPWLGVILVATVVAVAIAVRRRWQRPRAPSFDGVGPIANVARTVNTAAFARLRGRYGVLIGAELALLAVVGAAAGMLAMRPLSAQSLERSSMSRDVMLCLDVSGSMKELDESILRRFVDLAEGLPGDRIGLTIWNGAAISVFPLTDDADYVDGMLEFAVDQLNRGARAFVLGTEEGGSSLIGDGLASCAQRFDRLDESRARSIVLATDNALAGDPIISLLAAAEIAASYDIRVYAVAPAFYITDEDAAELEAVATITGGAYLTTDDDQVVDHVIEGIVTAEAAHLDEPPEVVRDDRPRVLAGVTLAGVALIGLTSWALRR